MADRLTQLQDCLDQLANQFYASLRYITTHHPNSPFPNTAVASGAVSGSPSLTQATANTDSLPNAVAVEQPPPPSSPSHRPSNPSDFEAATRELAHDLILKEQQIESIINSLPSIDSSRAEQEERIQKLEAELRQVEGELISVRAERGRLLERVETVIGNVKRV